MRDTERLRRRLLVLAGVLGGPATLLGCDTLGQKDAARDTAPNASAIRQFHGASGKWCAPPALARVFVIRGSPSVGECAKFLDGSRADRAVLDHDAVEGFDSESYAFYDPIGTAQERETTGNASLCCYNWRESDHAGRPLTLGDSAVTAAVREARATESLRSDLVLPRSSRVRDRLAGEWLADALAEHASVASFARAALELGRLGAPPELVAAHLAGGSDEVDHARACFSIASAYAGLKLAPGPLPEFAPRRTDIEDLAAATFEEAVVGETVAALAASRAASECADPAVRWVLERIMRDETRHAALAWRTLGWAVARGGAPVTRTLLECAAAQQPASRRAGGTRRSRAGELGRLDAEGLARARSDAWREVTRPMLAALVS
jgi:hypothetical protein